MTTLEQSSKKALVPESMEMKFIKLGMLVPLFFSAVIAYNLVRLVVLGFMFLVR